MGATHTVSPYLPKEVLKTNGNNYCLSVSQSISPLLTHLCYILTSKASWFSLGVIRYSCPTSADKYSTKSIVPFKVTIHPIWVWWANLRSAFLIFAFHSWRKSINFKIVWKSNMHITYKSIFNKWCTYFSVYFLFQGTFLDSLFSSCRKLSQLLQEFMAFMSWDTRRINSTVGPQSWSSGTFITSL